MFKKNFNLMRFYSFMKVKPKTTSIALTPEPAILNGPVIVTCKSHGLPEPSYVIFHNDSKVISNEKTYVISKVNWNDSGSYRCIPKNKLGNESQTYILTVAGEILINR